jgi:DNA helicase II / ATP-dependent DNA helicase PcrA
MPKYPLNSTQKQAVEYTSGPLLLVAGAGTGKTTVITEKIAYLVENNLAKPEEILALTFTEKAAGEMEERIDDILSLEYTDMQVSTFHAFCQRILEHYGLDIGISNQFKLLTQTDAWLLIRQNLDKFNLDYYRPLGNPTKHIHEFIRHFSKCKDELITPEEYLKHAEEIKLDSDEVNKQEKTRLTEVSNAYHTYNQILLDNNSLDFGDLIFYTIKLLQERPNVLKSLQDRFKFILVDEFQDVNYAQYELVKLLTTKDNQLTVVGDDDQSIYAFRGASVSNIMRFKEDFPKAKEIVLTENYRSGQEILDLAYNSIQNNNPDRLEEKLKINKELQSKANIKARVEHLHMQTLDDEINIVVKKISELTKEKDTTLDDVAILVRANNHAEPFINALSKAQIPYEFLASSGLYKQPIVLDCFNFLKVVDSYHESSAIFRLLRLPFLNFSESDLQKLTYMSKKKSISYYYGMKRAGEFGLSQEGIQICDKLIGLIHNGMKRSRFEKPTTILLDFLENSGYFTYLTHEEGQGNREVIRQIHQLRQFFDYIRKYEESVPDAEVPGFLEHYNYVTESGDEGQLFQPSDTPDSVNILTIHSAKGLEFKYVFVVNMVEDRFPTRRRGEGISIPDELIKEKLPEGDFHIQEERRLFYVAITRAKEKLFLTSADDYGGTRKKKISRFLAELDFNTNNKERTIEIKQSTNPPIQKKQETVYQPPKKFSYSQINSYQRCPYQYKLMHVLKIPTKGSASFSFGTTMHNTLQKFYEQVIQLNSAEQTSLFGAPTEARIMGETRVPTLEELLEIYEKTWIPDWYKSKTQREDYFKKGKDILKTFYTTQEEVGWNVPLTLEGWFKIRIGEETVHGRIDRIDKLEDGTLEIIDYKTGKAKEKIIGDDKDQLLIYQIAAQTLPEYRNEGQVSQLTFYYLNDEIKTSFVGNEKDIEKLKTKISGILGKIKSADFIATPGAHICKYCDFKDICEFRRL